MTELKTKPNDMSVGDYLAAIESPQRRQDATKLCALIESITGKKPVMWGTSIIGFDTMHYKYDSGHEGDIMVIGLAARKQALTLYGILYYDLNRQMIDKLGKVTTGKGCLYVKALKDINLMVLSKMIQIAYEKRTMPPEPESF